MLCAKCEFVPSSDFAPKRSKDGANLHFAHNIHISLYTHMLYFSITGLVNSMIVDVLVCSCRCVYVVYNRDIPFSFL